MKKARRKPIKVKKYRDDKWFDWSKAKPGWYAHMSYGHPRVIEFEQVLRLPLGNGQVAIKVKETGYVNILHDSRSSFSTRVAALKNLLKDHLRCVKTARRHHIEALAEYNLVRKALATEERRFRGS